MAQYTDEEECVSPSYSLEQFLDIVTQYNHAISPMQVIAYILGLAALLFAGIKTDYSNKIVSVILAFFWLWVGIVFNILYWSQLDPTVYIFGILFIIQGILFLVFGVFKSSLSFRIKDNLYTYIGFVFVIYGMVVYQILGSLMGRGYPRLLAFGCVPCPTTVFTFGLLLWVDKKMPKFMIIIPFLFALFGIVAIIFGIYEDVGLVIAGILGTILILFQSKKAPACSL